MAVAPWIVFDALWKRVQPLLPKVERRLRYPASACPTGRRCRGSCSCCAPGSPGGICRSSSVSAPARTATAAWTSGSRRGLGAPARTPVGRAARRRGARVVEGGGRLQPRASQKGGATTGPSPVDRARSGSKHHLLVDATGIPLAWRLTGGNRHDVTQLIPLVDAVPAVRGSCANAGSGPRSPAARAGTDPA
jgi:Transposase DDE domain